MEIIFSFDFLIIAIIIGLISLIVFLLIQIAAIKKKLDFLDKVMSQFDNETKLLSKNIPDQLSKTIIQVKQDITHLTGFMENTRVILQKEILPIINRIKTK